MSQDSVPAGSYNDPFLSSVCVCESSSECHGVLLVTILVVGYLVDVGIPVIDSLLQYILLPSITRETW
jgi:hypothetical protein